MGKINLLSSKVYNRIAAGEVVERPASVVKELLENSIDAGADKIEISIENGGLSVINVSDNGSGIEKDDLTKALLPHATSKISKISDLDGINSLGFRGEALASIASVSKITIKSKTENENFGASIYSEGGKTDDVLDAECVNGTEISVNNLFFNAPVRAKFLKSEKGEETEITNIVSKFILGNPKIAFKYRVDGKIVLQSFGDGEESAVVCVYGAKVIDDCFKVDVERHGIRISGYIGKHYFTKSNRSFQTVFLNGRYISNQTISSAISNAFAPYLMKRQYPFYVLRLEVPVEIVDVNVHPNKSDVRFSNNQIIYGTIYSVVSKLLDGSSEALNIVSKHSENKFEIEQKPQENSNENKTKNDRHNERDYSFDYGFLSDVQPEKKSDDKEDKSLDIFAENKAYLESLEKKREQSIKDYGVQQQLDVGKSLKYIGQALNTYLIFDDGTDIYFIDQHAAHERILFDKLNESLKKDELVKQSLLVPFVLSLSSDEMQFVLEKISLFEELGIEIESFGFNAVKISGLPAYLSDMDVSAFFKDLLSDLNSLKNITANDVLKEKLAKKACRSAIKSGDKLSESDTDLLLQMLKGNLGLKCPHGRPIAVKITRTEIDKWFKRIV